MNLISGGDATSVQNPGSIQEPAPSAPAAPITPVVPDPAPAPAPAPQYDPLAVTDQFLRDTYGLSVQELPDLKNRPTFANELVSHINDYVAAGKPISEIQNFLQIQSLDVASLDAKAAIAQQTRMMYPDLTPAQVDSYLATKYGEGEDANLVAMTMDGTEAKRWLAEKKVSITPPKPQVQAPTGPTPEQIAQATIREQQWMQVAPSLAPANIQIAMDIPNLGQYTLDLPVEPGAASQIVQHIVAANRQGDLTPEAISNAKDAAERLYIAQNWKTILAKVIEDATTSVRGSTIQQLSGPAPTPVSPSAPPAPAAKTVRLTD